jgi:hypothetical protein
MRKWISGLLLATPVMVNRHYPNPGNHSVGLAYQLTSETQQSRIKADNLLIYGPNTINLKGPKQMKEPLNQYVMYSQYHESLMLYSGH